MCEAARLALSGCPFLSKLAAQHGEQYALSVALRPTESVGAAALPAGEQATQAAYEASFQLFHGEQGVVPLLRSRPGVAPPSGCPFHAAARSAAPQARGEQPASPQPAHRPRPALPLATISLSMGGSGVSG